jgi:hypothetical protein
MQTMNTSTRIYDERNAMKSAGGRTTFRLALCVSATALAEVHGVKTMLAAAVVSPAIVSHAAGDGPTPTCREDCEPCSLKPTAHN